VKTIADHIDVSATRRGLDPLLVSAIVQVESSGDEGAMRFEPHWYDRLDDVDPPRGVSAATERMQLSTSWGLMQVLGVTAREFGCDAPFLSVLCEPVVGIEYGCQVLASKFERYDGVTLDAVAAYNAGSVRLSADGSYANQGYVDKVMREYARQRGDVV
jgi:soluble lytic murein transglycosylase-like protein